jgi:hypothetical protein
MEKIVHCATSSVERGIQELYTGGTCTSICGEGYIYDEGICYQDCDQRNFQLCLPGILGRGDCKPADFNNWQPDVGKVAEGVVFMQENNCGNRRQVIGTGTDVCADSSAIDCAVFGTAVFK